MLDVKYFGIHSFLIINNYCYCQSSITVGKDCIFSLNFRKAVNSSCLPQESQSLGASHKQKKGVLSVR